MAARGSLVRVSQSTWAAGMLQPWEGPSESKGLCLGSCTASRRDGCTKKREDDPLKLKGTALHGSAQQFLL